MSQLQWLEDAGSRSAKITRLGTKDKATLQVKFKCFGTFSDTEVHDQAAIFFNANRLYTAAGHIFLVQTYEIEHLGGDAWEVVAHYESMGTDGDEPDPLKRSRSFDTTGQTTHMNAAYAERRYGENAPDMKGAIGVDADSVKGVDVITPALQWQEQYDVPSQFVGDSYIRAVADLTGKVNSGAFRGFDAGEVLFAGCSGSQQWDSEKGDGPWSLAYKFIASPNATNLSVGGIGGITKKGHEYLWVRYEDDVAQNTLLRKPKAVYVNEVYRSGDFGSLGLG
jgi:hypothetical protein